MFECTHTCVPMCGGQRSVISLPQSSSTWFFPIFHSLMVSYMYIINFSHFSPIHFNHPPLSSIPILPPPFPTSLPLTLISSFSVWSIEYNYSCLHRPGWEVICWSTATLFLETGSVTEPGHHQFGQTGSQQAPGIYLSPLSDLPILSARIYRRLLPCPAFYVGAVDSNSGPHACVVNILPTDSSPQPSPKIRSVKISIFSVETMQHYKA